MIGLYFLMVDRFADGEANRHPVQPDDPHGWHGGDVQGVIDNLDHLQDLGVDGVWLTPVTSTRHERVGEWGAFHGYWVMDLREPEPRLGDLQTVRRLADALHARGMKLYLDMVYNHVAYDSFVVTEHPDWLHGNGDITDWNDPVQVVTHDVHGLPDLAQERDDVYAFLRDASLTWLRETDADGFRVDAVRHLPAGFLKRLGAELRAAKPGFVLLGEVFEGNPETLAARWKIDELDAVFDFGLHYAAKDVFCRDAHPGRLTSVMALDRAYGDALYRDGMSPLVTFLDNHDVSRIRAECGEDTARTHQAIATLMLARGTPMVTWGTEAGASGKEEPANRADMDFEAASSHPTGGLLDKLLAWRAEHPALRTGRTRILSPSSWLRVGEHETVMVYVNRGDKAVQVAVPAQEMAKPVQAWVIAGEETPVPVPTGRWLPARSTGVWFFAGAASDHAANEVTVTFDVKGPEGVRVVGAGSGLGSWDPSAALQAPYELKAHAGDVLAYKLVVPGGEWDPAPDRFVYVTGDPGQRIGVEWGR